MGETRRKFDQDFKEGAVRLVRETGRPIAQVAKDLRINEGTLGNWVNADKRRRGDGNGGLSALRIAAAASSWPALISRSAGVAATASSTVCLRSMEGLMIEAP